MSGNDDMTVKEAMAHDFGRLRPGHPLLKTCDFEDVDSALFTRDPDDEGDVAWRPLEKTTPSDFTAIERGAGTALHASVKEYYNAFRLANRPAELVSGLEC
jgi:hypothetical protein